MRSLSRVRVVSVRVRIKICAFCPKMNEKRLLRPPTKVTTNLPLKSTAKVAVKNTCKENVPIKRKAQVVELPKKRKVAQEPSTELPKKKRAAWDVKGRLADLEEFHAKTETRLTSSKSMIDELRSELSSSQTLVAELKEFKSKLENDVQERSRENCSIGQELSNLKLELENLNIQHHQEIIDLKRENEVELQTIIKEKNDIMVKNSNLERDLKSFVAQNEELKVVIRLIIDMYCFSIGCNYSF